MMFPIFQIVIFVAESLPYIVCVVAGLLLIVRPPLRKFVFVTPPLILVGLCSFVLYESHDIAKQDGYDMSKPSLREALETYIETGDGDLHTILEGKIYPPVFGKIELQRYLRTWLAGAWFHDTAQDASYLPEAYNKGDDWFEATLGLFLFVWRAFNVRCLVFVPLCAFFVPR